MFYGQNIKLIVREYLKYIPSQNQYNSDVSFVLEIHHLLYTYGKKEILPAITFDSIFVTYKYFVKYNL